MKYVADASALYQFLVGYKERYAIQGKVMAHDLYKGRIEISVPTLWQFEIGNILLYGAHEPSVCGKFWHAFLNLPLSYCRFSADDHKGILDLARKYGTTYYDMSYFFLAQKLDCPLVSGDEKFIRKVGSNSILHLKDYLAA
ncbi:MAG: type II toxin-antitoxin system VapC family toxin [bacterium]|nr:type II toxin-antitoxin system VapC family toxin [bacterium]